MVWPVKDAAIQIVVGDCYPGGEVSGGYAAGQVELDSYRLGGCGCGDVHAECGGDEILSVDTTIRVVVVEGNIDAGYLDEHSLIIDEGYSGLSRISGVVTGLVKCEVGGGDGVSEG